MQKQPAIQKCDGWTDGRMDRRTDGQMDGPTDQRTNGQTDGRTKPLMVNHTVPDTPIKLGINVHQSDHVSSVL